MVVGFVLEESAQFGEGDLINNFSATLALFLAISKKKKMNRC
jgi:hypothetical protein